MSNKTIEKLAEAISPDIPGIPWDSLEQEYGVTAAELVYMLDKPPGEQAPAWGYQKHIGEAYDRASAIVATLNLPLDISVVNQAWTDVQKNTAEVGGAALAALKKDYYAIVENEEALKITVQELGAIVANLYFSAMYGAILHFKGMMQKATRPSEEIIANAEEVTKAFNIIEIFQKEGLLEPLRKKASTSGMGAVQIPVLVVGGVVLVLVASAAIAAVAWTSVATRKLAGNNAVMKGICERSLETKDPEMVDACIELSKINQMALEEPPNIGSNIGKYLMLGGGLYLLVLFGPSLARAYAVKQEKAFGSGA